VYKGDSFRDHRLKKKQVTANNMAILYECNHGETKSFLHVLLFDFFYFGFLIQS